MRNGRWLVMALATLGMTFGTGLGAAKVAWAQLDIFEKPQDRPPPRRRGFTFGTIRVGGRGGRKLVVQGNRFYSQGNFAAASLKFARLVAVPHGVLPLCFSLLHPDHHSRASAPPIQELAGLFD